MRLGRLGQARQAFRRALELGTDEIRSRIYLAYVERRLGNPQAAAGILEEGLNRIPVYGRPHRQEAELLYQLGLAYSALGRPKDATARLNTALSLTRYPGQRKIIEEAMQSAISK